MTRTRITHQFVDNNKGRIHAMTDVTDKQMQYLIELYHAEQASTEDDFITIASLARVLNDTVSNAGRVLTVLRQQQLIEHKRYHGTKTTDSGQETALKFLYRQRIIEVFLVQVMGFAWHEIRDDARNMAIRVDNAVLDRMWTLSGQPALSPFGEPIPDKTGFIPSYKDLPLSMADEKEDYVISRVMTRLADRLEYLKALGLVPNTPIRLLSHAPFQGPLQIQLEREYRIIGHSLAKLLFVVPAKTR